MSNSVASSTTEPWALSAAKGVLLLWFVYLLVGPTVGFGWIDSWHNEQRAVEVLLLCVTAVAFSLLMFTGIARRVLATRGAALICAFLGLGLVSAATAQRPFAAFAEVSLFALLFVLAAMTAVIVSFDKERATRWANYMALLLATAYVLGVLVRLAAALELGRGVDLNVLILGYANPRFPSALHTVLIPFAGAVAVRREESPLLRIGACVVVTMLWAINWGLGTRGIWLAYLAAVPGAIALLGWHNAKRLSSLLIGTAVIGVAIFVLFASTTSPGASGVAAPTQNITLTSREVLWRLSSEAIVSAPLFGIGPMNFAAYESYVGAHPHSWPLQVACEWGLVAMTTLIVALVGLFIAIRAQRSLVQIQAPAIALFASLALGLVDGNFVMPVSQSAIFLVLGWTVGLTEFNATRGRGPVSYPLLRSTAVAMLCIGASLVLIQYCSVTLSSQQSEVAQFRAAHPSAWLVPRLWEQGLLLGSQ